MTASLEELGLLPRKEITIAKVDRGTVRSIVHAEHALLDAAIKLGFDADEVHRGYAPHVARIMERLSADDKAEFERLFVEESLKTDELDAAMARVARAEQNYAEQVEQSKPPSTARIFMAGVNVTVLIVVALYFAFR